MTIYIGYHFGAYAIDILWLKWHKCSTGRQKVDNVTVHGGEFQCINTRLTQVMFIFV